MDKKYWFLIICLFTIGGFCLVSIAQAGPEHNVSGFAWSENIGLISFNSTNCDVDGDGTYEGANEGGGTTPAPTGCPTWGTVKSYGVNIAQDGKLSGHAWAGGGENADGSSAPTIGWISFDRLETGAPPSLDPCSATEDCIAKLKNPFTNCADNCPVLGWARACGILFGESTLQCGGGGWDGWIKLRGITQDNNLYEVYVDKSAGPSYEFHGWAWGGNETNGYYWQDKSVVGWASFNRFNCDPDGNGVSNGIGACPSEGTPIGNYKVTYNPSNPAPTALALSVEELDYCISWDPPFRLSWTFFDPEDSQSAYQVQIDDDSNFNSPIDSEKAYSGSQEWLPSAYPLTALSYDTTYYWRLMVWDSQDKPSNNWIYYNDLSDSDGDGNSQTFTTDVHRWSRPSFTVSNSNPEVGFGDGSRCWNNANEQEPCLTTSTSLYQWDFDIEDGFIDCDYLPECKTSSINHTYDVTGDYTVRLEITDNIGTCHKKQLLSVETAPPRPEWKEIAPFGWLLNGFKNIFANIANFLKNILNIFT